MKRPEDDKEFMEVVGHLISHPRFQKLDGIVQHHHSTRLEHSVNVSYTSYKIAKKFGWDAKSTARGGLLHDFFYYDWRVTKFNKSHAWVHPRIAVRNARKLVNLNKKKRILSSSICGEQRLHRRSIRNLILLLWWISIGRLKKRRHPYETELKIVSFYVVRPYKATTNNSLFLGDNYGIKCNLYD